MKLTKTQLKQIIKEELNKVLTEGCIKDEEYYEWTDAAKELQKHYRDRMSGMHGDEWIPEKSTELFVSVNQDRDFCTLRVAVVFDGKPKYFDDFPDAGDYIDWKLGYADDDEYWHPGVQRPKNYDEDA